MKYINDIRAFIDPFTNLKAYMEVSSLIFFLLIEMQLRLFVKQLNLNLSIINWYKESKKQEKDQRLKDLIFTNKWASKRHTQKLIYSLCPNRNI